MNIQISSFFKNSNDLVFFACVLTAILLFFSLNLSAQVGIIMDGSELDLSARLDVNFNNQELLPPRMNISQRKTFDPVTCGNSLTDARNGKIYSTILIGTQCWMAQNLNIGTEVSGTDEQTNNGIIEKYCYTDSDANCDVYGGLYQWGELVQYFNGASNTTTWNPSPTVNVTGICPDGWHIPTDAEWTMMVAFLGNEFVAGGKMKEANTFWVPLDTNAKNSSGFTALPGGFRHRDGSFITITLQATFWTATENSATSASYRKLYYNLPDVGQGAGYKTSGYSVRCLKDIEHPDAH